MLAISDPKWTAAGNRDLAAILYPDQTTDVAEKRRRSSRATHLLRLLRGHGLLPKTPKTHRYQVGAEARTKLLAILAAGNASPE